MFFFLYLVIIYCLPISAIILGIRWVLRKEGKERKAKKFTQYAFLALLFCLIEFTIYDYNSRRHVFEIPLKDQYSLEIIAIVDHGFLDNPVHFYMEIEDLNSGQIVDYEFSTGVGPAFQFYLDPLAKEIIYMHGIDSNMGRSMVIDMSNPPNKNKIDLQTENFEDLIFCSEISQGFELILQ